MRRPESVRRPPNRGAVDRDAMGLGRVQHELIECDPALRANTGLDPIRHSHARRHCPEVVGAAVQTEVPRFDRSAVGEGGARSQRPAFRIDIFVHTGIHKELAESLFTTFWMNSKCLSFLSIIALIRAKEALAVEVNQVCRRIGAPYLGFP